MRTRTICLALAFVLLCPSVSAQWIQAGGPSDASVQCFAKSGTNLFAGTWYGSGVYLSNNNGESWIAVNASSTDLKITALAVIGTNLFAGTYYRSGVYLSTNNGESWTAVNTGLADTNVNALAVLGTNLFAATGDSGVFLSTNGGTSWAAANNGLTGSYIATLTVSGTSVYAGTGDGVFRSTDNGTSWTTISPGWLRGVNTLGVSGTNFFAGSEWGITGENGALYRSTDNGASWSEVGDSLTKRPISSIAVSGTNIFAGFSRYGNNRWAGKGVLMSTNLGATWTAVNAGLTDTSITALVVSEPNLICGTWSSGVWRRSLSEMITSVDPVSHEIPHEILLHQNYPNPFNPSTTIKYELPKTSHVSLTVYDILGREVSVLVNEKRDAGVHEVKFDGANLTSGVYFYRLRAGDFVQSKKLMILK